jgi:hypothetical protein
VEDKEDLMKEVLHDLVIEKVLQDLVIEDKVLDLVEKAEQIQVLEIDLDLATEVQDLNGIILIEIR